MERRGKITVSHSSSLTVQFQGAYPSEPVFVNRPGSTDEQDGVLLSILIYSDNKRPIQLIALDPKDLKGRTSLPVNDLGLRGSKS